MSHPLRISVAKRTPAAAAQLAELGRRLFFEAYAARNTPDNMAAYADASFGPEQQLAELQDPDVVYLEARMEQQLVGYAKIRLHSRLGLDAAKVPEERLEIERLYVADAWIGTGLGAALMRRALEEARQQQCRAVVLGVWEHNEHARQFYQRFGFRPIGQHEFLLGAEAQTDLILRKGL